MTALFLNTQANLGIKNKSWLLLAHIDGVYFQLS